MKIEKKQKNDFSYLNRKKIVDYRKGNWLKKMKLRKIEDFDNNKVKIIKWKYNIKVIVRTYHGNVAKLQIENFALSFLSSKKDSKMSLPFNALYAAILVIWRALTSVKICW